MLLTPLDILGLGLVIQRRMEREALSPIGHPVIPMNRPLIHMDIVKETGREQTLQNNQYQQKGATEPYRSIGVFAVGKREPG